MSQRGWLSWSESARRERDLRSYSAAAAACSCWLVEPWSGALGPAQLPVNVTDHRDRTRRDESLRPRSGVPRLRRGPQRVGSLHGPGHPASLRHRRGETIKASRTPAGATWSDRGDLWAAWSAADS